MSNCNKKDKIPRSKYNKVKDLYYKTVERN